VAKLYFHYASMNAGKSASLLKDSNNYNEQGFLTLLYKPAIDTRTLGTIASRMGIEAGCNLIHPGFDLFADIEQHAGTVKCVFVDEAQFLSQDNVLDLCRVVDELEIPVMTYGLRTDFTGRMFEGSTWLMAWADELRELRGVCHCGAAARFVARVDSEGKMVWTGDQVEIGGNDRYVSLCRKHYTQQKVVA